MKSGDKKTVVRGDLTATGWKEKWNVNRLTDMHHPPIEGISTVNVRVLWNQP
jgi:hypothetical protein